MKEDTSSHGGADAAQEKPKDDAVSDVEIGQEKMEDTAAVAFDLNHRKTKPFIVLVAWCAALGGLIFGYDIAGMA